MTPATEPTVLVAGATGYIGGLLAHRLRADGVGVRCLVRTPTKAGDLERSGCEIVRGDVLEPESGIAAIGSGGNYALSAAKALADYEQDPEVLARRAMQIASEVCGFTNDRLTVEVIEA